MLDSESGIKPLAAEQYSSYLSILFIMVAGFSQVEKIWTNNPMWLVSISLI